MVHTLLAAWRVSLHRTRADWPIVAAAGLISLLAATLLAAGPIYSSAVAEAGLHRVLRSAPVRDANIEVAARVAPADATARDEQVRGILGQAVGASGVQILSAAASDSFALPGQEAGEIRDLVRLGFQEGLESNATLVSGAWPVRAVPEAPVQMAVQEAVATTLGLGLGDELALVSRVDAGLTINARVVAIYRPTDPSAAFWWDDAALLDGLVESPEYRTFGPLITTREDLLERVSGGANVRVTWHAFPEFDALRIDQIAGLRFRVEQLKGQVAAALPGASATATTGLAPILETAERSLLASRTGVLLLLAQLAILAGYAIALTADLIVDQRRLDTALLRSRGASASQVGILALAEAALIAVPAALIGPWLAALGLRLFNVSGPLAGIGLTIEPVIGADAYLAAGAAAAGCALLLVLPAFLAARSYAAERSGRARPGTRTLGQRVGLDIALLAVTVIGLWQLRLYGTPLTKTVQGALGIDPLLVAAPAVGILAGSVVALRIVPLLAHVADAVASRGRHLVGSLGARELARRPLRYTRTALLLILAMSMGVFSLAYGTTWTESQGDQADYQTGADFRVTPARGLDSMPGWAVDTAYRSIDGVDTTLPVSRDALRLTASTGTGELIGLDASTAASESGIALRDRADAAGLTTLSGLLVEARPAPRTLPLPGTPKRLAFAATVRIDEAAFVRIDPNTGEVIVRPANPGAVAAGTTLVAQATVRDARGLIHRFIGEPAPIAPSGWQFTVPLAAGTPARQATTERLGGALAYPIEVVGVELEINLPFGTQATAGRLSLDGVAVSETDAGAAGSGAGGSGGWRALDLASPGEWSLAWSQAGAPAIALPPELTTGLGMDLGADGGGSVGSIPGVDRFGRGVTLSFVPAAITSLARAELAAIVNRPFLVATAAKTGDRVNVPLPGGARRLRIVGVVESFPTTDPNRPAAIVDLASFGLMRYGADRGLIDVDEWWLDAGDRLTAEAVGAAGAGGPLTGAGVVGRLETRDRLSTDPLALATIGALSLGFVVAGLFAVIGLTVSAAVSARQRRTEFALLRALGLSPDQLSAWLWLENASLVLVSIPAGTVLGLLISWVVLPFITVTQGGAVPFPPVVVDVPWTSVLVLEAVSVGALAVTLALLARWMRGMGVGSVLRMGED